MSHNKTIYSLNSVINIMNLNLIFSCSIYQALNIYYENQMLQFSPTRKFCPQNFAFGEYTITLSIHAMISH